MRTKKDRKRMVTGMYIYDEKVALHLKELQSSLPLFLQQHSEMVAVYSEFLAKAALDANVYLGDPCLTNTSMEGIRTAAYWHDIGKVCISNDLWESTGPLSSSEYSLVKFHPELGVSMLMNQSEFFLPINEETQYDQIFMLCVNACIFHHERWDGTGYPHSCKGLAIPLIARIVAIADAFDSMTALRPYSQIRSQTEALDEIWRCAGTQFDPILAKVFVTAMSRYLAKELQVCG